MSVIAFHEKAGRSQVNSWLFLQDKVFLPPSSHCRHASIRTLEERIVSLGARWAFSFQPVLPSDWRPVVSRKSGTWARRLTQSPDSALAFVVYSSWNDFDFVLPFCFTRLPELSFLCCCATGRILLRSPTGDAATLPAFSRSPRWLAFCRSSHHVPPA